MPEPLDPLLAPRPFLAFDVEPGRGVVAHEHGRETRHHAAPGEVLHTLPDLAPHRRSHGLTVDRPSHARAFRRFGCFSGGTRGEASRGPKSRAQVEGDDMLECRT